MRKQEKQERTGKKQGAEYRSRCRVADERLAAADRRALPTHVENEKAPGHRGAERKLCCLISPLRPMTAGRKNILLWRACRARGSADRRAVLPALVA